MAATTRSVFTVVMLIMVVSQSHAQETCSSSLGRLNACARFLVPGGGAPSADCCSALQSVDHDCICNTLRIASRIPTQCHLPALACPAN